MDMIRPSAIHYLREMKNYCDCLTSQVMIEIVHPNTIHYLRLRDGVYVIKICVEEFVGHVYLFGQRVAC